MAILTLMLSFVKVARMLPVFRTEPLASLGIVSAVPESWLNAAASLDGGAPPEGREASKTRGERTMQAMSAGVTRAGTGIDAIVWNILGKTYVPKQVCEQSFSWQATFPPGTFVPPHIHPTQDEFIYMFEGRLDCVIDSREFFATTGDLLRLPMTIPHGLFNKSDQ